MALRLYIQFRGVHRQPRQVGSADGDLQRVRACPQGAVTRSTAPKARWSNWIAGLTSAAQSRKARPS